MKAKKISALLCAITMGATLMLNSNACVVAENENACVEAENENAIAFPNSNLTWSQIRQQRIDKNRYPMAYFLIESLNKYEYTQKNFGTGGEWAQNYSEDHYLCKKIEKAYNKTHTKKVFVKMLKLSHKYAQLDIYDTDFESTDRRYKIGEKKHLGIGNSYYESAWNFGSGRSYWIKEETTIPSGMPVEISGIAKLNDDGSIKSLSYMEGEEVESIYDSMILISNNGVPIGWASPIVIAY